METFLSAQEELILKEAHRASRSKRHADRIKTILLLNFGYSYKEVAKVLFLDDTTLRTYFKEYQKGGFDELVEDKYEGKMSFLTPKQQKHLILHLNENLYSTVKEIVLYVNQEFKISYSVEGMTNLLHKLNFTYKKTKIVPGKANLEKQKEFIIWYENLKKTKGKEDVILFLDGTHPTHNTRNAYGWIQKGVEKYVKTNTGRERLNLNGASRIKLTFLPPYSPNLNPIEKLWHFFHKKILYNKYYPDFKEFEKESLNFFKNIKLYKKELDTFVTDNFHLLPT